MEWRAPLGDGLGEARHRAGGTPAEDAQKWGRLKTDQAEVQMGH